ncbi:class F sortase [Arsenicicoccus dermatophilus]|uniref:class F sortase n=1 Tax=Arsenicicoccus dermatophilus TaxID=1076331 RepID=UPI00391726D1
MTRATIAGGVAALTLLGGCGTDAQVTHHRTEAATAQVAGRTSSAASSGASLPSATGATRPGTTTAAASSTVPPAAPRPGAAPGDDGSRLLVIAALGVRAPVTGCGTEDGTVTPPGDVGAVCRWTGSQPFDARTGTTVVVGHSTRSTRSVGALEYVRELKVGDTATVAGQTWRVAEVLPGVDKHHLPAWIVSRAGARQLALVTCETTSRTRNDIARLVPAS